MDDVDVASGDVIVGVLLPGTGQRRIACETRAAATGCPPPSSLTPTSTPSLNLWLPVNLTMARASRTRSGGRICREFCFRVWLLACLLHDLCVLHESLTPHSAFDCNTARGDAMHPSYLPTSTSPQAPLLVWGVLSVQSVQGFSRPGNGGIASTA